MSRPFCEVNEYVIWEVSAETSSEKYRVNVFHLGHLKDGDLKSIQLKDRHYISFNLLNSETFV